MPPVTLAPAPQTNTAGSQSVRSQYQCCGVRGYYQRHGSQYRNPHEPAVRQSLWSAVANWGLDLSAVLDLACGSGEVTLALRDVGAQAIEGVDPYTAAAYETRTGQAARSLSFEQIAAGALDDRRYSLIVCSYALHLLAASRLPQLAYQLSRRAPSLLILTPHKRPHLRPEWGWELAAEMVGQRVRARLYRSANQVI